MNSFALWAVVRSGNRSGPLVASNRNASVGLKPTAPDRDYTSLCVLWNASDVTTLARMTNFKEFASIPRTRLSLLADGWMISPIRKLLFAAALVGSGGAWCAAEVVPAAREARPLPFLWGAQYYRAPTPDDACWEGDLQKMREMNFNSVKYWVQWRGSHMDAGRYNFDDLDRLMEIAGKNGLKVTLNTIFDIAPVWLYERYPDAKQVRWDGSIVEPQAVQHRQLGGFPGPCYRHPGALKERQLFMRALLENFGKSPTLDMVAKWGASMRVTCR